MGFSYRLLLFSRRLHSASFGVRCVLENPLLADETVYGGPRFKKYSEVYSDSKIVVSGPLNPAELYV